MSNEGISPRAAVIFDRDGSLYGTLANDGTSGAGAVFRLKPTSGGTWTEETLYAFTGGDDGYGPLCRLVLFRWKTLWHYGDRRRVRCWHRLRTDATRQSSWTPGP